MLCFDEEALLKQEIPGAQMYNNMNITSDSRMHNPILTHHSMHHRLQFV